MIHETLEYSVFPCTVHCIIGDTMQHIDLYISDYKLPVDISYNSEVAGLTQVGNDGNIFICIAASDNKQRTETYFVHECVHAAMEIINHMGADISYKNQELIAYIVDDIYENFKQVIDKYYEQNSNIQPGSSGEND